MDKIVSSITLNDYFKPTIKLVGIDRHQIQKDIKRVYNEILDTMADKTNNFLANL